MATRQADIDRFKETTGYTLREIEGGRLYYRGLVALLNEPIRELPERLTIEGGLDIRGTKIEALPEGLEVKGHIHMEGELLTELLRRGEQEATKQEPQWTNVRQAEIDRFKALTGCTFTEREDGWLVYNDNVDLSRAEIQELERIEVGGWLDLDGSSIERMKQVKVGKWLELRRSKIKDLKRVKVGGTVYLNDTHINRMDLVQDEDE